MLLKELDPATRLHLVKTKQTMTDERATVYFGCFYCLVAIPSSPSERRSYKDAPDDSRHNCCRQCRHHPHSQIRYERASGKQARRSGYDKSRKMHIQGYFNSSGNWLHPVWAWQRLKELWICVFLLLLYPDLLACPYLSF